MEQLEFREFILSKRVKQREVLSPLICTVYLDYFLCELRQINGRCHMNGYFVGAIIYADDKFIRSYSPLYLINAKY